MAQTKTRFEGIASPDMTIKEESHIADKDQYVQNLHKAMQRQLEMQNAEMKRRQEKIERLEAELLREKRYKHTDHICEQCNKPCVDKSKSVRDGNGTGLRGSDITMVSN